MTMVDQCCNLANRSLADYIPPTKFRSKTLILDRNLLTNIRNIKYCSSLYQLSVCQNKIDDMSPVGFLQKLKLLHLIDNVISDITGVGDCPELEEINLSRNCLQTFCGLQHCSSLVKVDLSYNSIFHLSDITSLTLLKELYLHGNELQTLESAPLCLPVNLQILSLADNKISDIGQLAYLTRLKQLQCISLAGNECASLNSKPYQVFTVMCCPSIRVVDEDPITAEHREHAKLLERKMMMSGDSSFCGLRDDRSRPRSNTDLSTQYSKESMSSAANPLYTRDGVTSRDSSHSNDTSSHSNDTSTSSTFSAYDEYNDRPAASGAPRMRTRRGSGHETPPPERTSQRNRSQSLFVSQPHTRVDEDEMECESVYIGVGDSVSMCLSPLSSSRQVSSRDTSRDVSRDESNTTVVGDGLVREDPSQESLRAPSLFFVPLAEQGKVHANLCNVSLADLAGIVKIQAVWRGYVTRKKGVLKEMAGKRYQSHFMATSREIAQLTAALDKERELSTLYRYMISDLCKRLNSSSTTPSTRSGQVTCVDSKSTQITCNTADKHAQTEGLVNTLISSLCANPGNDLEKARTSLTIPLQTDARSMIDNMNCNFDTEESLLNNRNCYRDTKESLDYTTVDIPDADKTSSIIPDTDECFETSSVTDQNSNLTRTSDKPCFKSSVTDQIVQKKVTCPADNMGSKQTCTNPPRAGAIRPVIAHMYSEKESNFEELKKRFESPEHLNKITSASLTTSSTNPVPEGIDTPCTLSMEATTNNNTTQADHLYSSLASLSTLPDNRATSDHLSSSLASLSTLPDNRATSDHLSSSLASLSTLPDNRATSDHLSSSLASLSTLPDNRATSDHLSSSLVSLSTLPDNRATCPAIPASSNLSAGLVQDTISMMRNSLSKLSPRNLNLAGIGGLENFRSADELVNE